MLSHQGFSLVEVLVALVLVVMMFSLIPKGTFGGSSKNLEETAVDIERAIRFSVNEAILRNAIVRISFDLTSEPQTYAVEYGPGAGLVLPEYEDESRLSLKEREARKKQTKNLDAQFNRVDEFSDKAKEIPEGVRITGVVSSYSPNIITDSKAAIYFYPTGEKDNALVFFTTEEEMVTLDIPPFEDTTSKEFYTYTQYDLNNIEDSIESRMKDVFEKWLRD